MPRASWSGFLRLSLVSCPIYLSPATARTKSVRLRQVRVELGEPEDMEEQDHAETSRGSPPAGWKPEPNEPAPSSAGAVTPITVRPHDPRTGEELEKREIAKAYEYERGQFVTLSPEELKGLKVESSEIINLDSFVPRAEIDPLYFNVAYYVYPDGAVAAEAFQVIAQALAEAERVGIGRVTIARRERMVAVEPRGAGMVLFTLRAADEVRPARFDTTPVEIDPEAVAIGRMIIERRAGRFDPESFRDRYQDALRALIETKKQGLPIAPKPVAAALPALDLMAALKRSLAEADAPAEAKRSRRKKPAPDRKQPSMLLPLPGRAKSEAEPAAPVAVRRHRKA